MFEKLFKKGKSTKGRAGPASPDDVSLKETLATFLSDHSFSEQIHFEPVKSPGAIEAEVEGTEDKPLSTVANDSEEPTFEEAESFSLEPDHSGSTETQSQNQGAAEPQRKSQPKEPEPEEQPVPPEREASRVLETSESLTTAPAASEAAQATLTSLSAKRAEPATDASANIESPPVQPNQSTENPNEEKRSMATLDDALSKAIATVPECLAAGYVDVGSGMLLGVKTVDSHPSEVMDLLAAATHDLFQGPNVTSIEQIFKKARGLADDGFHYFKEVIVNSENLIHVFIRSKADPDHVICFVCRLSANLGMVLTKARSQVPVLENSL